MYAGLNKKEKELNLNRRCNKPGVGCPQHIVQKLPKFRWSNNRQISNYNIANLNKNGIHTYVL